jgi:hypothetical protein
MQRIILIGALAIISFSLNGQLVINEVMARNDSFLADEFGEYDDWIEIYNSSNQAINIAGGYFTDDLSNTTLHLIEFGDEDLTTIPANGYRVFWADGTPEQGVNHLGFSLSAGGESIALVMSDGEFIADAVQFADQENDISYGRETDGALQFQFFSVPTPNATNQFITPELQEIHINEIQPLNATTIADESGVYEPWLELYNPNAYQVNLAGYIIDFNDGEAQFTIENTNPNASVIESDNHKLFWCDDQSLEGLLHTNFELSTSGSIKLYFIDGVTLVDELIYSTIPLDESYGSDVDGSSNYIAFDIPTPDVTNQLEIIFPEELYLNEIMAVNALDTTDNLGEYEDWIEIYNPNNVPVDLSGYHLTDNLGGGSWQVPSTYPDSVTVPAQGFLLFWADNDEEQGVRHTDFKLGSSGETLVLLSRDNFTVADSETFPVQSEDVSWGREEDGEGNWIYFIPEATTPEYSNHGAVSVSDVERLLPSFYPNPAAEKVFFSEEVEVLELYTLAGGLIVKSFNCKELCLFGLPAGLYLLRVNSSSSVLLEKL